MANLSTSLTLPKIKISLSFIEYGLDDITSYMLTKNKLLASIHNNFARKQVGDTQKRGKPEMLTSCRNSLDFH